MSQSYFRMSGTIFGASLSRVLGTMTTLIEILPKPKAPKHGSLRVFGHWFVRPGQYYKILILWNSDSYLPYSLTNTCAKFPSLEVTWQIYSPLINAEMLILDSGLTER